MILKISLLTKKNFPKKVAVEPKIINTNEKPRVKKIVLTIIKLFFFYLILQVLHQKYMKYNLVLVEKHTETKN